MSRGLVWLPLNGVPAAKLRAGHARPLRSTRGSDLPLPGVFSGATGGHGAVKTAPYKPPAIAASRGRDDRLSKKVCSPLGPLCEGAPPAGGGGENCTAVRNISGYGKVLSLRPFGAPLPLWRKRHLPRIGGVCLAEGGFSTRWGAPLGHLFLYAVPLLRCFPLGAAPAGACRSATAGGGS